MPLSLARASQFQQEARPFDHWPRGFGRRMFLSLAVSELNSKEHRLRLRRGRQYAIGECT